MPVFRRPSTPFSKQEAPTKSRPDFCREIPQPKASWDQWRRLMTRHRLNQALVLCAGGLLLWSCYEYGAFLKPAKTVVAVALPALGLLWVLMATALGRRSRRLRVAEASPAEVNAQPPGYSRQTAGTVAAPAHRVGEVRWGLEESLLCGLAFFGALSALWSLSPVDSLRAAGILAGACLYLYMGRLIGSFPSGRLVFLWLIGTTGGVISLLSVVGYALRWERFSLEKGGTLAATGTFGYANALAGLLLLTLAATVAAALETQERHRRSPTGTLTTDQWRSPIARSGAIRYAALVAALGVQLAALVLTWSKGAAVVAGVVILVWLIARAFFAQDGARRRRWLGVALALLLVAGVAAGGLLLWKEIAPQMAVSGLPPSDADPKDVVPMTSNAFRIKTWGAALKAAGARPAAGWGLDTFYEAYSPFKLGGHTAYAHNVVVQHLVEVGGIGTVLLVSFFLVATLRRTRMLLGPFGDPRVPLVLGTQAFALHNLVDLTWYFPALLFTFALLLGLAMPPRPQREVALPP